MKAKSFLEFYSQFGNSTPNNKQVFFYAQSFHPDMIVDFFDNTERLHDAIYGVGSRRHIEISGTTHYSPMGKVNIPFGTLDHFIGDCQRFNIELVWKKEIIDKYFI